MRTIFNFLGPSQTRRSYAQLLGVAEPPLPGDDRGGPCGLGCAHAARRHRRGRPRRAHDRGRPRDRVRDGTTAEWFVEPADVGLDPGALDDVAGGEPADNAAVAREVLAGQRGPAREISLLNAGAAIYVGGGADDLRGGVEAAREAVDSGAAAAILDRLTAS